MYGFISPSTYISSTSSVTSLDAYLGMLRLFELIPPSMARSALTLVVALVLLCHAGFSIAEDHFDPVTHNAAPPATKHEVGREEKLLDLDAYVTGSSSEKKAVIMISDIYGWKAPLFRKLADKIASHGFYVVAPDYFRGDSVVNISDVARWLPRHPPAGEVETTEKLVAALKAQGKVSVGLNGFCWGAKVAVLTGKQKNVAAVVQAHPSLATESDYVEVKVPISVLASPSDGIDKFKDLIEERSKEDDLDTYVKIFTQVQHGWTVRYDETDKKAVKKANRAHRLIIKWLRKHL